MELPPQPDPNDFVDSNDWLRSSYHDALREWRVVCLAIIAAESAPSPAQKEQS